MSTDHAKFELQQSYLHNGLPKGRQCMKNSKKEEQMHIGVVGSGSCFDTVPTVHFNKILPAQESAFQLLSRSTSSGGGGGGTTAPRMSQHGVKYFSALQSQQGVWLYFPVGQPCGSCSLECLSQMDGHVAHVLWNATLLDANPIQYTSGFPG